MTHDHTERFMYYRRVIQQAVPLPLSIRRSFPTRHPPTPNQQRTEQIRTPMIDVPALRADTQACERIVHFNNAGASLMPEPVYRTVVDHIKLERDIGGYEAESRAAGNLNAFYDNFAALLGVAADEIAYVENATRAWDMAFYALPLNRGDRILTHESEYVSNYLGFLHHSKSRGIEIDLVPSDGSGQIDVEAMARMVTADTKLVAITHVPTQGGLVNPAAEVGRVTKEFGLTYLLDGCQSVGQLRIDVQEIGCDILSGTGRKFLRGPRGTGFLYVSRAIIDRLDPPFIDLRAANWLSATEYTLAQGARRFENWESFIAGRLGLAKAVQYALDIGMDEIEKRVVELAKTLRERLSDIPGVTVRDRGERQCGIVTFDKQDESPDALARRLQQHRINVSISEIASARLDFGGRGLQSLARASVHYFNTEHEIERFCAALENQ